MAISVLMVYEPIDSKRDMRDYWRSYVDFYEKFWDGPATPNSTWFGQDYENFRESLSKHMGMDKKDIRDCFFMKDDGGNYFIAPVSSKVNINIFSAENFIPFEWFLMYDSDQKKYFFTHTGFGAIQHDAIYYVTSVGKATENLEEAAERIAEARNAGGEDSRSDTLLTALGEIDEGIRNILDWLSGFDNRSFILLNYGEICAHIVPESMKNEDSVSEIKNVIELARRGETQAAETSLKILISKWEEIRAAATGGVKETAGTLQ